jgi:predicted RND superfamily exporter protein
VSPYLSDDGRQIRISVRVVDSYKGLNRNQLLEQIRADMLEKFDLQPEQLHLTGAMVLYNNMLQSLFDSQIKTLGYVFAAIMLMLLVLFRSLPVALISMVPSLVSAASVLGLMGWIGLPLDLMTITITAITIGIAVDDTIHYVHRFHEELPRDGDYRATVRRCHGSIGKAMYYTSLVIIAGFSILSLAGPARERVAFSHPAGCQRLLLFRCSVLRIGDAVQWWCLPGSLKPSLGALIWPSMAK